MQIEVDEDQYDCVEEFAEATGRSTQSCFREALSDWIQVVARTVSQTEKMNIIGFPERVTEWR